MQKSSDRARVRRLRRGREEAMTREWSVKLINTVTGMSFICCVVLGVGTGDRGQGVTCAKAGLQLCVINALIYASPVPPRLSCFQLLSPTSFCFHPVRWMASSGGKGSVAYWWGFNEKHGIISVLLCYPTQPSSIKAPRMGLQFSCDFIPNSLSLDCKTQCGSSICYNTLTYINYNHITP